MAARCGPTASPTPATPTPPTRTPGWPPAWKTVTLEWQQNSQNFVITDVE